MKVASWWTRCLCGYLGSRRRTVFAQEGKQPLLRNPWGEIYRAIESQASVRASQEINGLAVTSWRVQNLKSHYPPLPRFNPTPTITQTPLALRKQNSVTISSLQCIFHQEPLALTLRGRSLRPVCHFALQESPDYLQRRQSHLLANELGQQGLAIEAASVRVLEVVSRGTHVRNTRRCEQSRVWAEGVERARKASRVEPWYASRPQICSDKVASIYAEAPHDSYKTSYRARQRRWVYARVGSTWLTRQTSATTSAGRVRETRIQHGVVSLSEA